MKRKYILLAAMAALALTQNVRGEVNLPIDITFAARGEASVVGEVTVTNLSNPDIAPVTLQGTDILRLVDSSSIPTAIENIAVGEAVTKPILTPNPSMGDGTLIFDAKESGAVRVSIYTTGGVLLESATLQVNKGRNTAFIPSQQPGIYLVNIEGRGLKSSTRWICGGTKSGSHIAIGGAAQWASTTLPFAAPWSGLGITNSLQGKTNTPLTGGDREGLTYDYHTAEGTNVVRMNFHEGDLLRFDGTNGQMRTIVHISPESSHDVFFDFFRCEDADGYNYPIVRSGDMMWMLEDLHPLKLKGMIYTSSPNIWKNLGDLDPGVFVNGNRGYYTVQGARLAMPEGWEMPSIDEMYAYIKRLRADSMELGDFLKDRDADWPMILIEGPDSIHMNLNAYGYVNENGELINEEVIGAWLTRNTINQGCPTTFEISAMNSRLYPFVIHGKRNGFTVRGCRMAPSVYNEMLVQAFNAAEANAAPRRLPMELVNSNGPLGSYYTYGSNRKSVFFDYSCRQLDTTIDEQRSGILYKKRNESNFTFTDKNLVDLDVNGANVCNHLRKMAAQGNAAGYENVVYASWSKPFRVFTDGTTAGSVATEAGVMGEGVVNITIYGDSTQNHAVPYGYKTRTLLDQNGNDYYWRMPSFNNDKLSYLLIGDYYFHVSNVRSEYFARAFNLNCINDMTGDGVDEIVMNVANKIAIFDGVTLRCLRERQFADAESYIGTPNLRFDVADVNGDGNQDIVLILNSNEGIGYLRVYDKGHIDEDPVFTKEYSSSALFCDVKVGYLTGSSYPEIAVLTRGLKSGSNSDLDDNGFLYVSRLEYNDQMKLKETVVLGKTTVECSNNGSYTKYVGNMDLVFANFRGSAYNADLIVSDGLWRYDDQAQKPTLRFKIFDWLYRAENSITADGIVPVTLNNSDRESVMFMYTYNAPTRDSNISLCVSMIAEVWLNDDDNSVGSNWSFTKDFFGWGDSGPYLNGNENYGSYELTRWMDFANGFEINSQPVICKFTDRERATRFRFLKHEVTFSEPRIYAAIAAAPYYKGLDGYDKAATEWGHEKYDGEGSQSTDTWGGSLIVGFEHSFSVPIFSSSKLGLEFTAKATAAFTKATEYVETKSYGQSYTADLDHRVVMHATPYDTYTYEIVDSDNPDDLGTTFVMSMPRTRRFIGLKLEDYVRLTASQRGVSRPQRVLYGTPGVPSSYPPNYNDYISFGSKKYPFMSGQDLNGGNTYEMVGTGGSTTRTLSLQRDTTSTSTVEIGNEIELVATVGGVKAGLGFNYNHTDESSHVFGEEFTVAGTVPGLPSLNDPEHPQFNWNIFWFYVKDEGGVYPVINYAVTER